jgi:hypothetical protein
VHLDVKHLPKLRNRDGITPKRSLYVAIDRCSRWVHLAVKNNETTASATAFLKEAIRAFPFPVTHVLTDRGSCFVADAFEAACRTLKVEHRTTRPYTPRTNGMVERFTGRVQREVLGITIHSHRDLETLLHGFNHAYNARRQRVLGGVSPDEAVRRRLQSNPRLNSRRYEPPSDPCVLPKALTIVEAAKDVSHPTREPRRDLLVGDALARQENDPGSQGQGLCRLAPGRECPQFGPLALAQDQQLKWTAHPDLRHNKAPEFQARPRVRTLEPVPVRLDHRRRIQPQRSSCGTRLA